MADTLPRKYRLTYELLVEVRRPESLGCSTWKELETLLADDISKDLEIAELPSRGGISGSLKFVQMTRRAI